MFRRSIAKKRFAFILATTYCVFLGCNPGTSSASLTCSTLAGTPQKATAVNQAPLSVGCGYYNEPCVTVTICVPGSSPGSSNCQSIPNVLLDTGSVGLRLFSCAVTIPIQNETDSLGNAIGDFVGYLDGSCDWGPVKVADVYIGSPAGGFTSEKASAVPIQIIDSSFATVPPSSETGITCVSPDFSPALTGFNGILGVGLSTTDCFLGPASSCASQASNGTYYSCTSTSCTPTAVPTPTVGNTPGTNNPEQVTNPVYLMQSDNNGVILNFPSISSPFGATSLPGSLTLGIGTESGSSTVAANTLGAGSIYRTDGDNNFQTNNFAGFDGASYSEGVVFGFIDSGSNTLAFPTGSSITNLPLCADNAEFYCPSGLESYTANHADFRYPALGSQSAQITFQVVSADELLSTSNPNLVFDDIASTTDGSTFFDWGFPFFINRTVYVHMSGGSSAGGAGATIQPFWAWTQP